MNYYCWGIVGGLRLLSEKYKSFVHNPHKIKRNEVAAIIPAKNESAMLGETINSLKKILPAKNIHIISDCSNDGTELIAKESGVKVLAILYPPQGKAEALTAGIEYFKLDKKYKAILFLDADSIISRGYLKKALPFFDDPEIIAVAGYAKTLWQNTKKTFGGLLLNAHRERIYFLTQALIRYGQTWKKTNVTHIIPGFASIYRSNVLSKMHLNAKGLIIEDFNMAFEVHHKNLGKIACHPHVWCHTQDPTNFRDYFKQINRWSLGFWQTVFRHGIWPSSFWAALLPYIIEVFISSIIFVFLPVLVIFWHISFKLLFYTIFLPDYLLTAITAMVQGRLYYFVFGFFFPFIRILDAFSFLYNFPKALFTISSGTWVSPKRQEIAISTVLTKFPNSGGKGYGKHKN